MFRINSSSFIFRRCRYPGRIRPRRELITPLSTVTDSIRCGIKNRIGHQSDIKKNNFSAESTYREKIEDTPPFKKVLAANRGEIAIRIMRACNELGVKSVGIYSHEDRFTQHRYKADQAFLLSSNKSPVAAYLDIPYIVNICKENSIEAVHPGYGFLSENEFFAESLERNGIKFIGPTVQNLHQFGDKTAAKEIAIKNGIPVIAGSENAFPSWVEAKDWIEENATYPVIVKAAMGGGGRGIRVVQNENDLKSQFMIASNEAKNAFGDGRCFVEKYVSSPRHIEVQCLGDGTGNVIHIWERDCSVQRRHQKVIEIAPAASLPPSTREAILQDAVRLLSAAKYRNAGTVEFLVDREGKHYFMEVNPRVQVEHTVTEEISGIDIVQSQIKIASGMTLYELGLSQDQIPPPMGVAMQCRVTTEDPSQDFRPDSGTIDVFRMPAGMGIRIDDGPGFPGAKILPHYDSLLVKITARARNRRDCAAKLARALREFRVRGVTTNKSFVLRLLEDDQFIDGYVDTGFIAARPELLAPLAEKDRAQKLLHYLGEVIVNGTPKSLGASGPAPSIIDPIIPDIPPVAKTRKSLKEIFDAEGVESFAKEVRNNDGLLITDTTWRDAHQSLLATRLRTIDMLNVAKPTSVALKNCYSLECWGGATFDVSMRFLHEDPWDRLAALREAVPDIPLQMLLRGANAVGYTSYADNVVFEFCRLAKETGMDVFRVFDSLNYLENLKLGIDAVGQCGGIIEGAVCYTGDITDPKKGMYNLEYYLNFVRQLNELGIHVLAIKDMAGLLKPEAATMLVSAIRAEHFHLPIHVHTHDTAGTGVASMLAAAKAGANVVDAASDALSGVTSQPSLGALVAATAGTDLDTKLSLEEVSSLNEYWEECRGLYSPFESGVKSGSADTYFHEMPGGQYTNLLYQSNQLGLRGQWSRVKKAYHVANKLLGDIIKVTPSSKVTGDLAQFIVANNLTEQDVIDKAETLSFPRSVIEYFQGHLGIPPFGFPEPLRSRVLKGKTIEGTGLEYFKGRPGADLPLVDLETTKNMLEEKWGSKSEYRSDSTVIRDVDVMSYIMYPSVFDEYMEHRRKNGNLSYLDTRTFLTGMKVGQELNVTLEPGKHLIVKLVSIGPPNPEGLVNVQFEVNGQMRVTRIQNRSLGGDVKTRLKAMKDVKGSVGSPMRGIVLETKVHQGDSVKAGDQLLVLSAMKMETAVCSPVNGIVNKILVTAGDSVDAGDLLIEILE